jgi:hypothetical protein
VTDAKSKKTPFSTNGETKVYRGTEIRIEWAPRKDGLGAIIWPFDDLEVLDDKWSSPTFADQFRRLVEGFALFNPHATIRLNWFGATTAWKATNAKWEKWRPCQPTSPHWYEQRHLERLIGAYVTHDRDTGANRLVSDFVSEFDGLTGSAKRSKVLAETELKRICLSAFVAGERLDSDRIAKLLASMQQHTRPVNPGAYIALSTHS